MQTQSVEVHVARMLHEEERYLRSNNIRNDESSYHIMPMPTTFQYELLVTIKTSSTMNTLLSRCPKAIITLAVLCD